MKKFKIVFFGTDNFSAPTLRKLLKSDSFEILAVVTKPDAVRKRGKIIEPPLIATIAQEFNSQNPKDKIKIFQPDKLHEIESELRELNPDIGVLVSYGKIVPQSTIDIFPRGIINFHPSLLPKYRGPSPIESAILNGDKETGLTLMKLAKEMDAGPILYQEKINLNNENAPELREKFAQRGAELLAGKLPKILSGEISEIEQKNNDATYCRLFTKSDGEINPKIENSARIERKVRAYLEWPKTRLNFAKLDSEVFAKFPDQDIIITRAEILAQFSGDSWPDVIKCAENTHLQIVRIISPKSGKEMSFSNYLHGLK